eukprot:TRINITY_DN111380_c0_g1_i1.p1 TRINITY_DN111380_c0_g1~~TRINITY_DN111380_c0_g1_i1.p1  ORF type:complete len:365 (+),score=38.87 TRINITY_DN111380_c0_g1_i1:71-1165(+)
MAQVQSDGVVSTVHTREGVFCWRIEHFDTKHYKVGEKLFSPQFSLAGCSWKIYLYPGGRTDAEKDFVSCYLQCETEGKVKTRFNLRTKADAPVDLDNSDDWTVSHMFDKTGGTSGWGFRRLIEHNRIKTLPSYANKASFVVQVTLRVYASGNDVSFTSTRSDKPISTVAEDVKGYLASTSDMDATLRCQGSPVHVHALVLKMRSPVFRRMLDTGMQEGSTKSVDLPEAEDVVKSFVHFLYTDELDQSAKDPDSCCHLLKLAHRYEMQSLVDRCVKRLSELVSSGLEMDTVMELLMLADEMRLTGLKTDIISLLICSGKLADAQACETWTRLSSSRPHLGFELVAAMVAPASVANQGKKRKAGET